MIKKTNFCILFIFISSFVFCEEVSVKTVTKNKVEYFSINEFISVNNLKSTYYQSKEKLEVIYEGNKIYFSPQSSFCRINDKVFHMLHSSILINNKIYVPAESFKKIIKIAGLSMQITSISGDHVVFNMSLYNIHDFYIEKKDNGVELSIYTSKTFKEKNISASIDSNGWLNITVVGGKIDSLGFHNSKIIPPFKTTRTARSDNSSQISYLLNQKIDDTVVSVNKSSINISLSVMQNEYAEIIQKKRNKKKYNLIVLDAGHGGKDPGAIGINKLEEKEVTLDIAKQLTRMLERNSKFKVINTREEDVFIPLWKRTQIANNVNGDMFISIHANSTAKSSSVHGFETFLLRIGKSKEAVEVAKRENSVILLEEKKDKYKKLTEEEVILATITQNTDMKASEDLASIIQNNLAKKLTNSRNRGVKQAGFHVLVGASMPNVLVEVGFLSNKEEAKKLSKYQHRRKIATALYQAIIEFDTLYEKQ
tara:strand:- start:2010 stop:3449 length:1440 start_codon:yes stop_codon:yes gene_type:complete